MAETKYKEGMAALERGNKASAKGLFKRPDWETAASEYSKAATYFRNAKSYEQAKQAYIKAADANAEAKSFYLAAQAMDGASAMAKSLDRFEEGADLLERASDLYTQHMAPDQTSAALRRAGEMLVETNVDRAIDLYLRACDVLESEGREHMSSDTFKATYNILLRNKRYEQTAKLMTKQIAVHKRADQKPAMYKLMLSQIVVLLANDDAVGANVRYQDFLQEPGFMNSEEGKAAHNLLEAFESGDQERLTPVITKAPLIFLDNEIARTAKQLKVVPASAGGGEDLR